MIDLSAVSDMTEECHTEAATAILFGRAGEGREIKDFCVCLTAWARLLCDATSGCGCNIRR